MIDDEDDISAVDNLNVIVSPTGKRNKKDNREVLFVSFLVEDQSA